MVFIFSTPGRIALACSITVSVIALIIVSYKGVWIVVRTTDAVAISPDDYRTLASMAEDVCLATGKPFPELMLIDDPSICNMFAKYFFVFLAAILPLFSCSASAGVIPCSCRSSYTTGTSWPMSWPLS